MREPEADAEAGCRGADSEAPVLADALAALVPSFVVEGRDGAAFGLRYGGMFVFSCNLRGLRGEERGDVYSSS